MLYPSSGTTIRTDLATVVEEALQADNVFIAEQVSPQIQVAAKSGTYPKVTIVGGELLTVGSTLRTRGGSYNRVTREWTSDTYDCLDRGLEEIIDDVDTKDMARFFDLESYTTRWILRNIRLDYEKRIADLLFNTSNWANANSSVAYTEANIATINFPKDVADAVDNLNGVGVFPNTIIMSQSVLLRLKRSTLLQNFIRGAMPSDATMTITSETIRNAFADLGITNVLIGRSKINTAAKGKTASISNVWSNSYIWVGYVNPNAGDVRDAGALATLVWNAEGGLFVVESYRDEQRRSNIIRVRQNTAEKIIDSTAGRLINTQWA